MSQFDEITAKFGWVVSTCGVILRQSCVRNWIFGKVSSSGSKFGEERPRFALPCFEHTARDLAVRSASLPDSHPHTRQPPPHPASEIIPSRLYRLCGFSKISSKFLRNLGALSAQLVKEIWVPGERNSGPSQDTADKTPSLR